MKLNTTPPQKQYLRALKQKNSLREVLFWVLGLGALALMEPDGKHMFSLCPFSWVWENGCWGCGLGHGIAYLFRGEWQASWEAHPLALPAVFILLWRCGQLLLWSYSQSMIKIHPLRYELPIKEPGFMLLSLHNAAMKLKNCFPRTLSEQFSLTKAKCKDALNLKIKT